MKQQTLLNKNIIITAAADGIGLAIVEYCLNYGANVLTNSCDVLIAIGMRFDDRITGRVDDVLNVSGHRIGTAEVENAINMHAGVVESAVVGYPHDVKGQGNYAFVIYNGTHGDEELTRRDIIATVSRIIGPIAKPDKIQVVPGLPKTRSGKILRKIIRNIANGEDYVVPSTIDDPASLDEIKVLVSSQ